MSDQVVLSFEELWQYLQYHANCIVSAGTADTVIYDHEDYHWHFAKEGKDTLLVQVIRGKHMVGEMLVSGTMVTFVQGVDKEGGDFLYECYVEGPEGPVAAYYFTLSHAHEPEEPKKPQGRWVH